VAPRVGYMREHIADNASQLVQRIARGERQALTELYARYQQLLFSYLLQLTPDRGLVEEILQDTLVAVWKSAPSFEGRSTVQTWLIGIARRQAHNTLRQRTLPFVAESEMETLIATEPEPEVALLANASREELVIAFNRLTPFHREVLFLAFIQELSQPEMAKLLNVPVGTVKSRLSNAKRMLRTYLTNLDAEKETQQ